MSQTTISRQIKFETGHRLSHGYTGKCRKPHGHNYTAEVELTAPNLNRFGMVADFGELVVLKEWIDAHIDHTMLMSEEDPMLEDYRALMSKYDIDDGVYVMKSNPTAENIAALILDWGRKLLGGVVVAVTVWETDSACACCSIEVNDVR